MNHQPFEDWLLDPKKLDPKQKQELQVHLQACPDCTALAEVELALHASRTAAPVDGFTERFQVRLADRQMVLRRRYIRGFSLLTAAVAGVLAWFSWPMVAAAAQSPVNTLSTLLSYLIGLWTSLQAMGHVSELLFKTLPGFVPPVLWIVLMLGACGWFLVWFLSMKKFTKLTQGV